MPTPIIHLGKVIRIHNIEFLPIFFFINFFVLISVLSELYIYIIIEKCTSTSNFQETLCQKMYPLFLPVATWVSFKLRFFNVRSRYLCFYPHLSRDRESKVHHIMDACLHKIFCNVCKSFASEGKQIKVKIWTNLLFLYTLTKFFQTVAIFCA